MVTELYNSFGVILHFLPYLDQPVIRWALSYPIMDQIGRKEYGYRGHILDLSRESSALSQISSYIRFLTLYKEWWDSSAGQRGSWKCETQDFQRQKGTYSSQYINI
jgi:hypothetical protein